MDKIVIKAKKVECIIGLFFLLPPVLGVFAFVLQLFNADTDFSMLRDLSSNWTNDYSSEGGWRNVRSSYLFRINGYSWSLFDKRFFLRTLY